MTSTSASMDAVQGWLPLTPADAEAIEPGRYILDSEYLTVDGIYTDAVRPYEIKGRWCTRALAGSTAATHAQGSTLVRYYPDAPPGTPPPDPAITPVGGIVLWSGTAAEAAALAPTWALCDGVANSPGPDLGCYDAAVLADSPTSYWRLGEASGTAAVNQMGAHAGTYTGTLVKGATGIPGAAGDTAITLDGTGAGYVTTAWGTAPAPPGSMESWIKHNGADFTLDVMIAGMYQPSTLAFKLAAFGNGTDAMDLGIYTETGNAHFLWTPAGDTGWHHLVGTISAGGLASIYFDGIEQSTGVTSYATGATSVPFSIGSGTDGGGGLGAQSWPGSIDEVAVYPSVLSPAAVAAHYFAGFRTCALSIQRME